MRLLMTLCHHRNIALIPLLHEVATNMAHCRGGITGFANATGRNPTTLSHKFNPHDTPHLNLPELLDFLAYVTPQGRRLVLDCLHQTLGGSFAMYADEVSDSPSVLSAVAEVLHSAAELTARAAVAVDAGEDLQPANSLWTAAKRQLNAAYALCAQLCRERPPLLAAPQRRLGNG
ncbi:phage regulatory CII family protein [Pseudomonas sp. NPDC086581]|uniref:phage regulatory CII family protein n=1 Tax=Pseudomonas sp. NPDC086581 TaxID=3364432 RepID=UPI003830B627